MNHSPAHLTPVTFMALAGARARIGVLRHENAAGLKNMMILTEAFTDDLMVSLWADNSGRSSLLALGFSSTREVTVTPRYSRSGQVPSTSQLLQLFEFIFDHPETFQTNHKPVIS